MLPVLYQDRSFVLYTHDVFTIVGLLAGLLLYFRELRRNGMLGWPIFWIAVAAVLGGGVGARLITAWEHIDYYRLLHAVPLTYAVEHSGKSIIGGIVGGYVAIVLAKRAFGYTRSTGDAYAFAIPVGVAIGRVGCFLSELPLGTPTDLPWGVSVDPDAAANFARCPGCGGPMHPSMLYEIVFNLVALALMARFRHRLIAQGDLLKAYLLSAAAFRFLVEYVRANEIQALGLTGPQIVLLPLVGLLALFFVRRWRSGIYRMPEPRALPERYVEHMPAKPARGGGVS